MVQALANRGMGVLLTAIYRVRLMGWRITRPVTLGVRMVVIDGQNVLLVRSHGHQHWHLPGGAVNRYEGLADAARREVREETGCAVEVERLLGMYFNAAEYKSDHIAIFAGRALSPPAPRWNIEIAEARYFPLAALPPLLYDGVRRRLDEYANGATGITGPW